MADKQEITKRNVSSTQRQRVLVTEKVSCATTFEGGVVCDIALSERISKISESTKVDGILTFVYCGTF